MPDPAASPAAATPAPAPTPDPSGALIEPHDWTFEHIRTLITWLNFSNVNIFLIDCSIKYYKMILSNVMAYSLLFTTISSTISISQLGISRETSPVLYNGVQYTFIAASILSTLLIGYVKLFKVQESLDTNIILYKEWLSFATRISSEFQMPVHMRASALKLLQEMKTEYIDLFCRNPNIPFAVQRSANLYFQRNLGAPYSRSCWSRPNYIRRTNVFFIFQDIIKNEIKRLSAELTPVNYDALEEQEYSDVVPSYYHTNSQRRPATPRYIGPKAIIEYKYDGPFIVIEVKDRNESAVFARQRIRQRRQAAQQQQPQTAIDVAAIAAAPGPVADARRRVAEARRSAPSMNLFSRLKNAARADDSAERDNSGDETPYAPSRRERQMSFSLPECSIIQQSSSTPMSPARKSYQNMIAAAAAAAAAATSHGASSEEVERHRYVAEKAANAAKVRAVSIGGELANSVLPSAASSDDDTASTASSAVTATTHSASEPSTSDHEAASL